MLQLRLLFIATTLILGCNNLWAQAKPKETTPPAATSPSTNKGPSVSAIPVVIIETNKGTIEAELWEDKAPATVKNFLTYVDEKFYDNTVSHRVISNFMVQFGGMTQDLKEKKTHAPIKNEAQTELRNDRGTLAMGRTSDIHSATSHFFINQVDNEFLNHKGTGPQTYGYAVFGKVIKGLDVVDAIAKVPTGRSGYMDDVPKEPVIIKSISRKK